MEREEQNKYCVCVCSGALGLVGNRIDGACVCVCANERNCCGLSQPDICVLLSNELSVYKKEQSAGRGIGRCPANQNIKSDRAASTQPSDVKSDSVWLKQGQMGRHDQLNALCWFVCMVSTL